MHWVHFKPFLFYWFSAVGRGGGAIAPQDLGRSIPTMEADYAHKSITRAPPLEFQTFLQPCIGLCLDLETIKNKSFFPINKSFEI